jgi:hypothetical protein
LGHDVHLSLSIFSSLPKKEKLVNECVHSAALSLAVAAKAKNEIDFIKTSPTVPKGILHLNGAKKLYCKLTLLNDTSRSLVALLRRQPPHEFSSFIIHCAAEWESA